MLSKKFKFLPKGKQLLRTVRGLVKIDLVNLWFDLTDLLIIIFIHFFARSPLTACKKLVTHKAFFFTTLFHNAFFVIASLYLFECFGEERKRSTGRLYSSWKTHQTGEEWTQSTSHQAGNWQSLCNQSQFLLDISER